MKTGKSAANYNRLLCQWHMWTVWCGSLRDCRISQSQMCSCFIASTTCCCKTYG